ncbi:hypothetical protein MSG28_008245 [Choristoneura fumiferana]|uniref:Uncharacterized protein n=1 Tax=Choristoneura fumiferana TaxID=7141 RepID=A0ACC0JAS0_CHOFU|nr:hypothetical protein MSG28_008245 [Choristoneura fumiferana]
MHPRWAATLDALGHACRKLGQPEEALRWHERALALRPGRAPTYAAIDQEIPQFPFGPILISAPPPGDAGDGDRADQTDHSDMSMSFELSVPGDD